LVGHTFLDKVITPVMAFFCRTGKQLCLRLTAQRTESYLCEKWLTFNQDVMRAWRAWIIVVTSAGNDGPKP